MSDEDHHIRVSESNYRALEARKRGGESFDDVVGRLIDEDRDLLAGFGNLAGTDAGEELERVAESVDEDVERAVETFGGDGAE
ncbi:antitoxin VapB family protein (plasmid) [Haloplanus ruber]|uniref:Antitoxin VapB family protein n=1 Tax=Haloplanus ruber TaxID=869892 RepID=A0ABD6CVK9_9EURY|nr:antitoxin VapB family protein [Haloplanus ruber]